MSVAIVTDSAAALPPEVARENSVGVVPMWLTFDGSSVREGEMSLEELLTHPEVKTSGPSPGEFAEAIEDGLRRADSVVVLTVASEMSSTHEAAVLGARMAGGDVRVVDTRTAAGAEALVVLAAATATRTGSIDTVVAAAEMAIPQMRLIATLPSLEHLARGGRVPNIAGWAGNILNIAPLFEFRNGHARPLRPALGTEPAYERILSRWRRDRVPGGELHVAALHANAREDAQRLLNRVNEQAEPKTSFLGEFGTVMIAHTGPGIVGLAWRWTTSAPDRGSCDRARGS